MLGALLLSWDPALCEWRRSWTVVCIHCSLFLSVDMMWQLIQVPASLSSPARWTTVNSGFCCLDSCSTMGHTPQSWAKRSPYLSCICLSVWSQLQEKELRHRERMLLHWGCADNLSITSSDTCLQTTRTRCVLKASRFSRAMSVFFYVWDCSKRHFRLQISLQGHDKKLQPHTAMLTDIHQNV